MKQSLAPAGFALWLAAVALWHPSGISPAAAPREPAAAEYSGNPITPIVPVAGLDPAKIALGKELFADPALSRDGSISCATCHRMDAGGTDRLPTSIGLNGQVGRRNAPTVFNSGLSVHEFWDGRAASLEDQMDGPIESEAEMGSDWGTIVALLSRSSEYTRQFAEIYGDGVTPPNIRDAIATYERSLATPGAPFDRFLAGDLDAITDEEKHGYRLFVSYGCSSCHQGAGVGGNMFQRFGILDDRFVDRSGPAGDDLGRYEITKDERDMYVFKVPSLRNVAVTAPYFHDGSTATLAGAIDVMGRYQLGRQLSAEEIQALAAFLQSLTGEYEGRPL